MGATLLLLRNRQYAGAAVAVGAGVAVAPGVTIAPRVAVTPGVTVAPRITVTPGVAIAPRVAGAGGIIGAVPLEAVAHQWDSDQQAADERQALHDRYEAAEP